MHRHRPIGPIQRSKKCAGQISSFAFRTWQRWNANNATPTPLVASADASSAASPNPDTDPMPMTYAPFESFNAAYLFYIRSITAAANHMESISHALAYRGSVMLARWPCVEADLAADFARGGAEGLRADWCINRLRMLGGDLELLQLDWDERDFEQLYHYGIFVQRDAAEYLGPCPFFSFPSATIAPARDL